MDSISKLEIPLFPLATKLVAGEQISLRIFEPRYLDMVKKVAGKKEGFGIVQILEGSDIDYNPTIASFGTLATIIDFETLPENLLGITVLGERHMQIFKTWSQEDGLIMAHVLPVDDSDSLINEEIGPENAGPLDRKVAKGLGIPTQEYVEALLNKRVKTEHLKAGSLVDGIKLNRTRVIFRYQGRSTFIDLDD
ncbi:MAG: LON peptidase substrate-binding domain-containing protein [Magnetococcales bacterium]|nr:LON peptidase substrate-binding domain-containing protein [Magnetococcales bacterium]